MTENQSCLQDDNSRFSRIESDNLFEFNKLLANPGDHLVFDHPLWKRPNIGDHVKIVSFDTQCNVQECIKLSKLPYLTVMEVKPIIVGNGDGSVYYWSYEISVIESDLEFLQWHYEIIK
jgi:hypothetical protein